jgi:hypothetical protein
MTANQYETLFRAVLSGQPDIMVCGEGVDGLDAIEKAKELKPEPHCHGFGNAAIERGGGIGFEAHGPKGPDRQSVFRLFPPK